MRDDPSCVRLHASKPHQTARPLKAERAGLDTLNKSKTSPRGITDVLNNSVRSNVYHKFAIEMLFHPYANLPERCPLQISVHVLAKHLVWLNVDLRLFLLACSSKVNIRDARPGSTTGHNHAAFRLSPLCPVVYITRRVLDG